MLPVAPPGCLIARNRRDREFDIGADTGRLDGHAATQKFGHLQNDYLKRPVGACRRDHASKRVMFIVSGSFHCVAGVRAGICRHVLRSKIGAVEPVSRP